MRKDWRGDIGRGEILQSVIGILFCKDLICKDLSRSLGKALRILSWGMT